MSHILKRGNQFPFLIVLKPSSLWGTRIRIDTCIISQEALIIPLFAAALWKSCSIKENNNESLLWNCTSYQHNSKHFTKKLVSVSFRWVTKTEKEFLAQGRRSYSTLYSKSHTVLQRSYFLSLLWHYFSHDWQVFKLLCSISNMQKSQEFQVHVKIIAMNIGVKLKWRNNE